MKKYKPNTRISEWRWCKHEFCTDKFCYTALSKPVSTKAEAEMIKMKGVCPVCLAPTQTDVVALRTVGGTNIPLEGYDPDNVFME